MTAERLRMDVIANNLANVNTTRTPGGGPFRREQVILTPGSSSFGDALAAATGEQRGLKGVQVSGHRPGPEPPSSASTSRATPTPTRRATSPCPTLTPSRRWWT